MSDEIEAVGTAVEGALLGRAVEQETGSGKTAGSGQCLNCQSEVTGTYCTQCGQRLHVHRSIGAFGHDILHSVLHFEGKFWRTLPLLAWKPGQLTRRYIHGERARFISPMALFLFSIFMMFAVFSFMGSPFSVGDGSDALDGGFTVGVAKEAGRVTGQIAQKEAQLDRATGAERDNLNEEILDLKRARNVMATMVAEDMPYPDVGLSDTDFAIGDETGSSVVNVSEDFTTGSASWDQWLKQAFEKANANPNLLLYKLKANGYKFAWLLIPISLPFVWLTMIGRRGYRFYDHAVFTTYSISFMSLLFISCALLAAIGLPGAVWALLLTCYPPVHMYRQLRHAYQLSRFEALLRVVVLLVFTVISLLLFFLILFALGLLG